MCKVEVSHKSEMAGSFNRGDTSTLLYFLYNFYHKIVISSYPSILKFVLGAQKNCLIETALLSTHNICFSG